MKAGKCALAVKELRDSATYLSTIRNVTRKCVAQGANLRLASASAGEAYLSARPGDLNGAKAAAHQTWLAYPVSRNCP
jgi:hypothetical protein